MAYKKPLALYDGVIQELQTTDIIDNEDYALAKTSSSLNEKGIYQEWIWGNEIIYNARTTNAYVEPTNHDYRMPLLFPSNGTYSPLAVASGSTVLTSVLDMGFEKAYTLNGSNGYIVISGTELLAYRTSSLALWFKAGVQSVEFNKIIGNFNSSHTAGTCLIQLAGTNSYGKIYCTCQLSNSSFFEIQSIKDTYNDGNWHLVVFGRDVVNRTLYVNIDNGDFSDSSQWDSGLVPKISGGPIVLGRDGLYNGMYFNGTVGPLRLFDHILTSEEVNDLWNSGIGN